MTLLRALSESGRRNVVVCHLDHGLRPGAAERRLVAAAARRFGYRCEWGRGDTRAIAAGEGLSLEAAARRLRYGFFQECARRTRIRTIVLAHHADDQEETILLNFFRGSGLRGLAGMPLRRRMDGIVIFRPWLGIPAAAIHQAAASWRVRFKEDPSNVDRIHTRNRIRHELIPVIRNIFGDTSQNALLRLASIARSEDDFIESLVPQPGKEISVEELQALPVALGRRLARAWLLERGIPEPGFAEVERVRSLLDPPIAKVNLPGGGHARRRAGRIFFQPMAGKPKRKICGRARKRD